MAFSYIFYHFTLRILDRFSGDFGRFLRVAGTMYQLKSGVYPLPMVLTRKRLRADGTASYTIQIRLAREGLQVYQESQTFARKQTAQAWARRREGRVPPSAVTELTKGALWAKEGGNRPAKSPTELQY